MHIEYIGALSNTVSLGYRCYSRKHLQHEVCPPLNEGVHFVGLGAIRHIFALAIFRLKCTVPELCPIKPEQPPLCAMTKLQTLVSEDCRERYQEWATTSSWERVVGAKYLQIRSPSLVLSI